MGPLRHQKGPLARFILECNIKFILMIPTSRLKYSISMCRFKRLDAFTPLCGFLSP